MGGDDLLIEETWRRAIAYKWKWAKQEEKNEQATSNSTEEDTEEEDAEEED